MALDVFSFTNYKDFLRAQIAENQQRKGYRQLLADAAGCQRTYLSQVLNTHIELTPEHAVGMALFWGLDSASTDFFLELVHFSRAGTPALRRHVQSRLDGLRKSREVLAERIHAPRLMEGEQEALYYSSWLWAALHMIVNLPDFQTAEAAAGKLGIPAALAQSYLGALARMGLVEEHRGRWRRRASNLHLPSGSPHLWRHHQSWRELALRDAQKNGEDSIHFTGLHTLSRRDFRKVADLVRELVVEARRIVEPSRDEQAACLCVDFFAL